MGNYGLITNRAGGLVILSVFLYLSACGLFKNVRTKSSAASQTQERKLELKTTEASAATIDNRTLRWVTDSGRNSYQLEIWPRGQFSFSPALGFQGEAEKLKLSGIQQAALNEKTVSHVALQTQDVTEISALQQDESRSQSQAKSVTSSVSWKIVFTVLFLVTLLTLWLLSKKTGKSIYN